ncbi:neuraminidase-like domain-containing protein [Streptomyces sp. NPDC051001]|uniref:Tc toxin subunit A-related protein n=1 Tax=Streptomyces sp. NPDC051001 TaxID=3155795 RepID=UPI0034395210
MHLRHDGISLWYATDDAPAPAGLVEPELASRITVGVRPADASNRVEVVFRVGDGPAQVVTARRLVNSGVEQAQYFTAALPAFEPGDEVVYGVVCRCAGRRVPAAGDGAGSEIRFRVGSADAASASVPGRPPSEVEVEVDSGVGLEVDTGPGAEAEVRTEITEAGAEAAVDITDGRELAAHAALSTLGTSAEERVALVEAGFPTPGPIARLPQAAFLRETAELLPRDDALRIHRAADAQRSILDALRLGERRAPHARPDVSSAESSDAPSPAPQDCGCEDCRAATSPMAFLTDLLGYTEGRALLMDGRSHSTPLSADLVARVLHQPLADLAEDCASTEQEFSQVRLCLESLLSLIRAGMPYAPDVATHPLAHNHSFVFAADVDGDGREELVIGFDHDASSWVYGTDEPARSGVWVMKFRDGRWSHLRPGAVPLCAAFTFPPGVRAAYGFGGRLRSGTGSRQQIVLALEDAGRPEQVSRFQVMQYEPDGSWRELYQVVVPVKGVSGAFAADVDGDGLDEFIAYGVAPPVGSGAPQRKNAFWVYELTEDGTWAPLPATPGPDEVAFVCADPEAWPLGIRFATAGDVNRDGRAEIVALPEDTGHGADSCSPWIMRYDSGTEQWQHTRPEGNPHEADLYVGGPGNRSTALLVQEGELFIGVDQFPNPPRFLTYRHEDEDGLAYAGAAQCAPERLPLGQAVLAKLSFRPETSGRSGAAIVATTGSEHLPSTAAWVMARAEDGSWAHLSPIAGHPLGADLEWSPGGGYSANTVLAADIDGDGIDELVFAANGRTGIWVIHRDPSAWRHLTPLLPERLDVGYVAAAYQRLLAEHGTSYEEIRRVRGAPPKERRALAERLGIALGTDRPDALDALLLDPATASQSDLEELFGLASFDRDPLSDGPGPAGLQRWRVDGAAWSADSRVSAADKDGVAVLSVTPGTPGQVSVQLLARGARQHEVAQGQGETGRPIALDPYEGNGVSGSVTLAAGTGNLQARLRLFPRIAVLRWLRLRELWDVEDWPQDPYTPGSGEDRLPVIDPDLVCPEDFRLPLPQPPGEPPLAFDLWTARRTWLDGVLAALHKKAVDASNGAGIDALLDVLRGPLDGVPEDVPWAGAPTDLPALAARLTTGSDDDVRAASQTVRELLLLPVDTFLQLMELRAASLRGRELTGPEWTEIRSILALAYKHHRRAAWLEDETKAAVRLDASAFVTTSRPVVEGSWPPQEPDSPLPLIDPELVALAELPPALVGAEARELWRRRSAQLADAAQAVRTAGTWDQRVDAGLGSRPAGVAAWRPWIRQRAAELDDVDPAVALAAQQAVEQYAGGLRLPAFRRLATVLATDTDGLAVKDGDRQDAERSLTYIRKVKRLYPVWRDEERKGPRPLPYWRARRAALPRWLAPPEAREAWLTALAAHTRAPAVDPDVVPAEWLHRTARAADLRVARATVLANRAQELRGYRQPQVDLLYAYDGMLLAGLWSDNERWRARADVTTRRTAASAPTVLRQVFGPAADRFPALIAALDAGGDQATQARRTLLAELGFTREEDFRLVMTVRNAASAPLAPSPNELADFDHVVSRAALLGSLTGAQRTVAELGGRLADVLAPARLGASAWHRLISLRELTLADGQVTDDEFGEGVDIVLRTEKERLFGQWREQEHGDIPHDRVRLGPDAFALPDGGASSIPDAMRWRVQQAEVSALRTVCRARTEQHRQVLTSVADAVLRTEQAVLPQFRDGLLALLPVPDGRSGAQWAADHLLTDTEDSGTRRTTRVGHAIDSALALLWSLRTGQLRDTYPQLALDAPTFDTDWRWIGSYATWRSAILVHLYPENLVRPSLQRRRSPGMSAVIEGLRDGPVTLARARRIAGRYGRHLSDVCRLDLDPRRMACASVQDVPYSPLMLVRGTGHPRSCGFFFALAPGGRVYWTLEDRSSTARGTGFETGFWHSLEAMDRAQVTDFVGTAQYAPADDPAHRRWLYLFARTRTLDGQGLVFLRYDLDTGMWDSESTPLELPEKQSEFTAWLTPTAPAHPPRVVVEFLSLHEGAPYTERMTRALNASGSGWERTEFAPTGITGDWQPLAPGAFDLPGVGSLGQRLVGDFDGNGIDELAVLPEGGTTLSLLRFGANRSVLLPISSLSLPASSLVANGRFTDTGVKYTADEVFSLDPHWGQPAYRHTFSLDRQDKTHSGWTSAGSAGTWQVPDPAYLPKMMVGPMVITAGQFEQREPGREVDLVAVCAATRHQDTRAGLAVWILRGTTAGFTPVPHSRDADSAHRVDPAHDHRGPIGKFSRDDNELAVTFRPCPLVEKDLVPPALAVTGDFDGDGRDELAIVPAAVPDDHSRANDGWVWDLHPQLGWRPLGEVTGGRLRTTWDLSEQPWAVLTAISGDFDGDGRDELLLVPDTPAGSAPLPVRTLDFQQTWSHGDPAVGTWHELSPLPVLQQPTPVRFAAAADLDGDGSDNVILVGDDWLRIYAYDRWTKNWIDFPLNGSGLGASAAAVAAGNLDSARPLNRKRRPRRGTRVRGLPDQLIVIGGAPVLHEPDPVSNVLSRTLTATVTPPHRALRFDSSLRQPSQCTPGWAIPQYRDTAGWVLDDTVSTTTNAQRSRTAWQDNAGAPATIRRYLQEAFHDLPIAIALALQDSQDYLHALDWFRLVYDYTQPLDRRKVDYGLVLDEHGVAERAEADPKDYARVLLNWVSDPLDPHAIAAIRPHTYTRATLQLIIRCLLDYADSEFTRDTSESVQRSLIAYGTSRELQTLPVLDQRLHGCSDVIAELPTTTDRSTALLGQLGRAAELFGEEASAAGPLPHNATGVSSFCVGPNPVLTALRLHTELNLFKLHTGRNISGMRRELEAYSAPTDQTSGLPTIGADGQLSLPANRTAAPTPYRYTTLIQQAQQLARQAQEVEASMLAAFEKRDAERLNLVRARQDVQVARGTVRLQELRVQQANSRVTLAGLQRDRAEAEEAHFQGLIDAGENEFELAALQLLTEAAALQLTAGIASAGAAVLFLAAGEWSKPGGPQAALAQSASAVASGLSSTAAWRFTWSQWNTMQAGYARTRQDWQFRKAIAGHDKKIGEQQVTIETDGVRISEQERTISELQADNAEAMVEFHLAKFTSAELYDWMAVVLERAYRWYLQQGTGLLQLATQEVAFAHHEGAPPKPQADYWQWPGANTFAAPDESGEGPERHGLTGSARLLQDIARLTQYAFETDRRKQQLTKTISLAEVAPLELQRLRTEGVMTFATPMRLFDNDFPGDYLRMIRRASVSVIASVPATAGIRATLSTTGMSRIVVGPDVFRPITLRREPESVALSAPMNSTGLFTFEQPQQSAMRDPFEGLGVDTVWEFRLPRPANPFDFRSLADVHLTIDYTAVSSADYRAQVVRELDQSADGERGFSLRHEMADAWWDLHNPNQSDTPLRVRFTTGRADFPPNVDELTITHVALAFASGAPLPGELSAVSLRFKETGRTSWLGGTGTLVGGVVSTQRAGGGPWLPMLGKSPVGEWELGLPDTDEVREWLKADGLDDAVLVVSYRGRTAAWPV